MRHGIVGNIYTRCAALCCVASRCKSRCLPSIQCCPASSITTVRIWCLRCTEAWASVNLSVCHAASLCKPGWTDRGHFGMETLGSQGTQHGDSDFAQGFDAAFAKLLYPLVYNWATEKAFRPLLHKSYAGWHCGPHRNDHRADGVQNDRLMWGDGWMMLGVSADRYRR